MTNSHVIGRRRAIRLRRLALLASVLAGVCLGDSPAIAVTAVQTTVNGLKVVQYRWRDSHGLARSVSLKLEGNGNPGHGGYAVQMAYRYLINGAVQTMTVNPTDPGDGFGYFVSHERERLFTDGTYASIANKIFHVDDSPLGRAFPVTVTTVATGPAKGIVQFRTTYHHYGTIAANGVDPNTGDDKPRIGTNPALFRNYALPVTITWYFQDGKDYPRIGVNVNMSQTPGPDRLSFDIRGPYGKLNFDAAANAIGVVSWGDRYHFISTKRPLTRNSTWTWNVANPGARYSSLMAGAFEMGLIEPRLFTQTRLNDGYSDGRGHTSATYFGGRGCPFEPQIIPCDYEWPYQSAQYELPYDNRNGATISEKMAWGSTPYYGTSLTSTYDGSQSVPFVGFPASKQIAYDVCVVLGRTNIAGLTKSVALAGNGYNCANTSLQ